MILAGATDLNAFYKGFSKLLEALKYLDKNQYYLCFFGRIDSSVVQSLDFEYTSFGFMYDDVSLMLIYSSADVFVAPSLMEAFGKTLAESMACGTPVVCFDATGPKDIVTHKLDGYKATPFDPKSLAKGIEWVLDSPDYKKLSDNSRRKVVMEFDNKVVAGKYAELYEEILTR